MPLDLSPELLFGGEVPLPPPKRRIFCNRTLNLRSIQAVGFDMDYTLVHYQEERWEGRAYEHCKERLLHLGLPVQSLTFDPSLAMLGLVLDLKLGNVVKANRFGYIKRASHGTRQLEFEEMRKIYANTLIDLSDRRWVFMSTLFGLSETCLFMQLVDLFDAHKLSGISDYAQLYELIREHIDAAHMEGALKAEILKEPEKYIDFDPDLVPALDDLRHAGKKVLLITNSEWSYTKAVLSYVVERHDPKRSWRSLFDLVIVGSRKPAFFSERMPAFEVIDEAGHLLPSGARLQLGKCYLGGNAELVEKSLNIPGEEILYVGDHIFSDVNVSKSLHRWRTGLIIRELEKEVSALEEFKPLQGELSRLMSEKELLEHRYSLLRLLAQRIEQGYGDRPSNVDLAAIRAEMRELRSRLVALDERIAPLAKAAGELNHPRWGLLMRTGNDKSYLARQIETHADIYTSRVSNFLYVTPFVYLRSPRGSLPHDFGPEGGV
ncbi:MAG: HAD-IG family 5'-nucleotidase [Sandaracinaceae bacterium]|nr:HAD-IG family 5'-nucleotidase [Sandaracinaceae bacterium]